MDVYTKPDREGKQGFTLFWKQDGRKRAQEFRASVDERIKLIAERGDTAEIYYIGEAKK